MGDMLKGRVAVITGAGNGLGRAHAIGMAAQGARVVVNDIGTSFDGKGTSSDPADQVVKTIKQSGGSAVASYDSVATEEGAKKIIQTAMDSFGRLDILVNNAGIIRHHIVYEIPTEEWEAVVKTHLFGTFYCTRAATAIMKEQGYGRIINTSSHIGFGYEGQSTYSTVKEAIVGFSRSVARDMAKYGTTCNVIRPIAAWRGIRQKIEQVEVNRPEDIAAWLSISPASRPTISTAASLKSFADMSAYSPSLHLWSRSCGKTDNGRPKSSGRLYQRR